MKDFSLLDRDALMNVTKTAHIKAGNSLTQPIILLVYSQDFFLLIICQIQFINEIKAS